MLHRGVHVLGSLVVGAALAAACSAGKSGPGPGDGPDGNGGSTSSAGTINLGGGSAGTNGIGGLGTGGGPGPDGGVPEEVVYLCPGGTADECCAQDMECAAASEYICTVDGECGKVAGPCTSAADCQNDTYCCDATCRGDMLDEPVCIPTHVGPGVPCLGEAPLPGVFSPFVQCEWHVGPNDPQPNSGLVLTTPLVANLPVDSGASAEIVIVTFELPPPPGNADATAPGVLRILSGQDCSLKETIADSLGIVRSNTTPALGNLDADADIEIVARRDTDGLIAFDWNGTNYVTMWTASSPDVLASVKWQAWDGPSIHDLNDDGQAEVILWDAVFDGASGTPLFTGNGATWVAWNGYIPVLGDIDADGTVELVRSLNNEGINNYSWAGSGWTNDFVSINGAHYGKQGSHFAIADFGTPGPSFDATALDGKAEIVATNAEGEGIGGQVYVYSQDVSQPSQSAVSDEDGVLFVATTVDRQICPDLGRTPNEGGGPPTIGNLDDDAMAEFAVAGASRLRVFDFSCTGAGNGCEAQYVRWSQPSQDCSSRQTGASIFDFEGDGKAEVVYADECFLRVYAGDTGEVLYSSPRTSATWLEGPVVADVDMDQNTEIVVNSAYHVTCPDAGQNGTPYVDPLHPGVRCDSNEGCVPGGNCVDGFCRCVDNSDCDVGMTCAPALSGGDDACRATHPNDPAAAVGGIRVLRERLDRWVSSRAIWNQHAYSISNVNEDGSIPRTSEWVKNWTVTAPGYNSFRQNEQGTAGAEDLPDITGRFTDEEPCVLGGTSAQVYLQATVCNRGKRAVGAALPATFYVGDPANGQILCTSYTDGPVPTEDCLVVYCAIDGTVEGQTVTMVVNDDGMGGRTTLECRPDNNLSSIVVEKCDVVVRASHQKSLVTLRASEHAVHNIVMGEPAADLSDRVLCALPIFPLPDVVLFPQATLPLHVFEPRYRELTRDVLSGNRLIGMARLKPGFEGDYEGRPPVYETCGVGLVVKDLQHPDGRYNVLLRGVARVRILEELPPERLYRLVRAERVADDVSADRALIPVWKTKLAELWEKLGPHLPESMRDLHELTAEAESAGAYADILAAAVIADPNEAQHLLEELDPAERLRLLALRVQEVSDALFDGPPSYSKLN